MFKGTFQKAAPFYEESTILYCQKSVEMTSFNEIGLMSQEKLFNFHGHGGSTVTMRMTGAPGI